MKFIYKLAFILLITPTLFFANVDDKKHEKNRIIKKEYAVNSNAKVSINNKYGDVKITTWNKNTVEIEVSITVKGDDLDDVTTKFDNIDVMFEASKEHVSAKTTFEKERSTWSFWKKSKQISYKINYTIKMPESNSVDLDNDYGSIYLDNLSGLANINCDYGKISIGDLSAENNNINLDYCSSSTIGFMKSGSINADYSKLTIEESENIKINSDYSNIKLEKANYVDFNTDYGAVAISDVAHVKGNSDYTNVAFGTVRKNADVNTDYGSVSIKNLAKGFETINIKTQYAGVRINVDADAVFNFELDLQYANFKRNDDKIQFTKKISKTTKNYYEGKFGKGNTNSFVKVKSQYGGVSIKENN